MQYRLTALSLVSMATASLAAYVPSEPWSTLTPSATLSGGFTNYPSTFGIAIEPVTSGSSSALAKRDVVTQITDGQIQATTSTAKSSTKTTAAVVTQITDGQVQATTSTAKAKTTSSSSTKTAAAVVTQITDGQVQATTSTGKTAAAVVTQITDGQIQATTSTAKTADAVVTQIGDGQIQGTTSTAKTAAAVVTQIGDGQIQATTSTAKTADAVVTQIGDGQIQATTKTSTAAVATQIGDGQVQASTATATKSGATQIADGQIQASTTAASSDASSTDYPTVDVACESSDALSLFLKDGILTDAKGRIGSIVANRQFQFDGPPPQAGAIYAAGWSVSDEGYLAIGNSTTFYQCLSGTFYNLYDESIGAQCAPVKLEVVDLVSC